MRITRRALSAIVVVAVLSSCGSDESQSTPQTAATDAPTSSTLPASAYPVTVAADNGDVEISAPPSAIVSLSPSLTEMLYAMGAGDQVIAVDGSSNYPEGTPQTDLSGFRPNVEAIGELQPDLVLLARDRDDVAATLASVGIPTIVLGSAADMTDVDRQIRLLGEVTGHPDEADTLAAQVGADVTSILDAISPRESPLTYFYELSTNYDTTTSDTFIGALLDSAGLVNIADGVDPTAGTYPQLSAEYVLEQNPDLIFVAYTDGSVPDLDELVGRPGWGQLDAAANDDLVLLDADISSRWGPRVVELVRQLADAIDGAGPE